MSGSAASFKRRPDLLEYGGYFNRFQDGLLAEISGKLCYPCPYLSMTPFGKSMYQKKARGKGLWLLGCAVAAVLIWLFVQLKDVLMPFAVAATLAYILNPLVERLERRKMKRAAASMLVMSLTFLVLLALVLVLVPMFINQFENMMVRVPKLVDYAQGTLLPWLHQYLGGYGVRLDRGTVLQWVQTHAGSFKDTASKVASTLMSQSGAVAAGLSNLLLLPLLLYYFLLDWKRWSDGLHSLIPRRYAAGYDRIAGEMDQVLGEFLRGQLLVMLIMGMFYGSGLMLAGLDSGFAIGMIAGLLVFIPYLGAFTGLLLSTLAALLQFGSWYGLIMVWVVFAIGQLLESFVVTPKIVGDRIGLSPFWVIFSLLAFGQLMGFVGMLIGLPLAAVSLVLLREGSQAYFQSDFYRDQQGR